MVTVKFVPLISSRYAPALPVTPSMVNVGSSLRCTKSPLTLTGWAQTTQLSSAANAAGKDAQRVSRHTRVTIARVVKQCRRPAPPLRARLCVGCSDLRLKAGGCEGSIATLDKRAFIGL